MTRGARTAVAPAGHGQARSARALLPGLDLVLHRRLVERPVDAWLPLAPGDRPIVTPGDLVNAGATIAERLREARVVEASGDGELRAGERWSGTSLVAPGKTGPEAEGELLFESDGRWRVATGEHHEPLESPVAGVIREVRAGMGIGLRTDGAGLAGAFALGGSARGQLDIATGPDGELLPRSFDVGSAGAILVVGARIDAESLTRARAMGVRGIIVSTLASKERRDFLASEARQRAALHRLPPLAVLVLHGTLRRPIAAPIMTLLERLAGREVAIVGRPPRLVFDPVGVELPTEPADRVHVRGGALTGRSGTWAGLAGLRRFAGGTHLEAGFVQFEEDAPIALPLADLERFD
ncbi:MAG: hypothetical protein ACJ75R_01650 [Solirubrobacterales bacterium]